MFKRIQNFQYTFVVGTILLLGTCIYAQEANNHIGWYAGAFGGYISGKLNSDDPGHEASTGDYKDDSPMAGILAGYNWQYDADWIAGVEVIIPLYMRKGTAIDKEFKPDTVTYEASYRYAIFVAAKWGRRFGKIMPYLYGSLGFANVNGKTFNVDENDNYSPGFEQSAAATHFVWQLGAAVDYDISEVIFISARIGAFIAAQADHTMPWNEPGPNMFGYDAVLFQFNAGYRL